MKTNVFKKAHEITKKIIRKGDSYRETFRLVLIFVYSEMKKGIVKMVELKGTEKQVKWANNIRDLAITILNERINSKIDFNKVFIEKKGKDNQGILKSIEVLKNTIDKINSRDDSKWFIEELRYSNTHAELIVKAVQRLD